jgi:hypothetical protein
MGASVGTAARRRWVTAGVTALGGVGVLAAGTQLAYSWRDELPDPVASHWGADGAVNGVSSVDSVLRVMLGGGLVLVLGFAALTLLLGQSALTRRIGAAGVAWSALFMTILTVGSLNIQRGLTDARAAGGLGGVLIVALVVSLVAAGGAAAVVPGDPRQPTTAPVDADAPRVVLAGDSPQWTGAAQSPAAAVVGLAVAALVLGVVVLTQLWALLILVLFLVALIAAMSSIVVRVDASGVTARSALGWPRTRVPLDELERADAVEVRPVRDFGGWGWRVGRSGSVGIVLRRGEGLRLTRTGGRILVITVDGATTAAGTVNALADRARRPR